MRILVKKDELTLEGTEKNDMKNVRCVNEMPKWIGQISMLDLKTQDAALLFKSLEFHLQGIRQFYVAIEKEAAFPGGIHTLPLNRWTVEPGSSA